MTETESLAQLLHHRVEHPRLTTERLVGWMLGPDDDPRKPSAAELRIVQECLRLVSLELSRAIIHDQLSAQAGVDRTLSLTERVLAFERLQVDDALKAAHGVVVHAAALLGIPRVTMIDKVRRHRIDTNAYREKPRRRRVVNIASAK